MPGIICAIRGGPNSRPTIEKAIELSKDTGGQIYFLYVVNLEFLSNSLHSHLNVMEEEVSEMGEFILLNAQEKAKRWGVAAEGVIRKGKIGEEIIGVCKDVDADYVILGKPVQDQEHNMLDFGTLGEFAKEIEEASGAKVVFAEGQA
jgi:nucleotide-binding universal stress UspA family protein